MFRRCCSDHWWDDICSLVEPKIVLFYMHEEEYEEVTVEDYTARVVDMMIVCAYAMDNRYNDRNTRVI